MEDASLGCGCLIGALKKFKDTKKRSFSFSAGKIFHPRLQFFGRKIKLFSVSLRNEGSRNYSRQMIDYQS